MFSRPRVDLEVFLIISTAPMATNTENSRFFKDSYYYRGKFNDFHVFINLLNFGVLGVLNRKLGLDF